MTSEAMMLAVEDAGYTLTVSNSSSYGSIDASICLSKSDVNVATATAKTIDGAITGAFAEFFQVAGRHYHAEALSLDLASRVRCGLAVPEQKEASV